MGAGGVWCQPQRLLFAGFVDNSTGWGSAGLASSGWAPALRGLACPLPLWGRQAVGAAEWGCCPRDCDVPVLGRAQRWPEVHSVGTQLEGAQAPGTGLSWRPVLLPGIRAEPNRAAGAGAGGGGEAGWGWRGFLVHTGPCQKPLGWWSPFLSSGLVISHSFHCAGTDGSEPVPKWWSSERNASGALVQRVWELPG